MTLTQLKYFHALCTYKTFSAAAENLHISQPSLSNAIKELENEFSVTLFIRQSRGVILTDAAQTLLEMSVNLLDASEKCENIMKDMGKDKKVLRLGIPPMIGSVMLADIYRDFLSLHPEIKLDITEMGQQDLIKNIQDGFVDMAILPHRHLLAGRLEAKKIRKFEIVCCASKQNPISKHTEIEPAMLKDVPLVLFKDNFFQTEEIKKWFSKSGISANILIQTSQLSTMTSLIKNNVAAGFMFRHLADKAPDLSGIPLKDPIYTDVSLAWKKDIHFFESMKKFKNYICKD